MEQVEARESPNAFDYVGRATIGGKFTKLTNISLSIWRL